MPQLNAYLSFDGTCAEAMKFYARTLGARLEQVITYGEMPATPDCPAPGPEHKDRVMHAYLVHKDFALMAGDTPPGVPFEGMKGVMLALTYDSADEAKRVFNALSDNGQVTMAPSETFWAEFFGMVTDRYGTAWGVNGGMKKMA